MAVLLVGVFIMRALLFVVYTRAPFFLETPILSNPEISESVCWRVVVLGGFGFGWQFAS